MTRAPLLLAHTAPRAMLKLAVAAGVERLITTGIHLASWARPTMPLPSVTATMLDATKVPCEFSGFLESVDPLSGVGVDLVLQGIEGLAFPVGVQVGVRHVAGIVDDRDFHAFTRQPEIPRDFGIEMPGVKGILGQFVENLVSTGRKGRQAGGLNDRNGGDREWRRC